MNIMISVIIPLFNCERYIEKTLNSVLKQTYKNFEVIIINDASIDDSLNIVKKFFLLNKNINYKIISNPQNIGISESINIGLRSAKGIYISFLGASDIFHIKRLEFLYNAIKNTDYDGSFSSISLFVNNKEDIIQTWHYKEIKPEEQVHKTFKKDCNIFPHVGLYKKSCFFDVGLCDPNIRKNSDYDIFAKFAGKYKFKTIKKDLYYYRQEDVHVSSDLQSRILYGIIILERLIDTNSLEALLKKNKGNKNSLITIELEKKAGQWVSGYCNGTMYTSKDKLYIPYLKLALKYTKLESNLEHKTRLIDIINSNTFDYVNLFFTMPQMGIVPDKELRSKILKYLLKNTELLYSCIKTYNFKTLIKSFYKSHEFKELKLLYKTIPFAYLFTSIFLFRYYIKLILKK